MPEEISLNYKNKLEININPTGVAQWAEIGKGFRNLSEAMNEVLYQASFLDDKGWASTEVTGAQYIATLTGVRYHGDPAQDWIFSDEVMHDFGDARKTQLRITRQDGTIILWNVTLANINTSGGESNQPAEINLTIHGNGAPTIITDTYLPQLTIVSVPGITTGKTAVYINPIIEAGNSYVYQVGAAPIDVDKDEVLTTGWTAWDGETEIDAETGQYITVAEIDASSKAQKAGSAVVTAA